MEREDTTYPASKPSRAVQVNRKTAAARYNIKILRGLETMLLRDPEADIMSALEPKYSQKLQLLKCPG